MLRYQKKYRDHILGLAGIWALESYFFSLYILLAMGSVNFTSVNNISWLESGYQLSHKFKQIEEL